MVDGARIGHVLDPRTGRPAPDFGSISVWTRDATAADCLSTGLYVLGPERALELARELSAAGEAVEVVVLERAAEALRARATPGLAGRLRALEPSLAVDFSPPTRPRAARQPSDEPTHKEER